MLDLSNLVIETPSWGYGDSGTRFGVFPQPGRPRDVYEKLDDAAEVHRLTGTAPAVACTSRGTPSTTTTRCAREIESRGLRVGAVNPNLFQDPDYKLGSVTHPDAAVREKAVAHMLECLGIATALGSSAQSLWLADGTNYPGQDDLRERRRRMLDCLGRVYAELPARAGVPGRVQVLRARLLRDRPRRLGQRAADLPQARRAREGARRPRPPRAGHEHRADRRLPGRRGPARRLSLQQPQVRRRRPDRRLGEPVRAVPDLRRADRFRRRCRGSRSTSRTTSRPRSRRWSCPS